MPEKSKNYQLDEWVKGNPIHMEECCPDFSCCTPETLAFKHVREKFTAAYKAGDKETTNALLGGFLVAAIENYNKKKEAAGNKPVDIYIAGDGAHYDD